MRGRRAALAACAAAAAAAAPAEAPAAACAGAWMGPEAGGGFSLEDVRLLAADFYASGYTKLGGAALGMVAAVLREGEAVAQHCPRALLQAALLRMEDLLLSVYQRSAESEVLQKEALKEASDLQLRADALEARLGGGLAAGALDASWPLARGAGRVRRYHSMLWDDVFQSEQAWAEMEQPGAITDEQFHDALAEVAAVLEGLGVEWWPCRGTLIALLRHGRRSGWLSRGILDNVERDIDVMLGVAREEDWIAVGRDVEKGLMARGWARCWLKSSVSLESELHDTARRDLLYCVKTSPAYVLLDVTSYVHGSPGPDVFVHGACGGGGCAVPPGVGPLRHAGGRLRRDAIRPLGLCRADGMAVPCPRDPLATIRAMIHSGLDAGCIALPNATGRDAADPWTARLQTEGLCAEDVRILRERSARLEAMGFESMAPYFADCGMLAEVMARPC